MKLSKTFCSETKLFQEKKIETDFHKDTVTNPQKVIEQPATKPGYGPTYKYVGKNAVVVLNQGGQVVTAYAKGSQGLRSVK